MKIQRFENYQIVTYEFHSIEMLKTQIDLWKKEFKSVNCMDKCTDLFYKEYCEELDNLMDKFIKEIDDYKKCKTCPESDHEDIFCRCEDRNIRIAKERRQRGESPWKYK